MGEMCVDLGEDWSSAAAAVGLGSNAAGEHDSVEQGKGCTYKTVTMSICDLYM